MRRHMRRQGTGIGQRAVGRQDPSVPELPGSLENKASPDIENFCRQERFGRPDNPRPASLTM